MNKIDDDNNVWTKVPYEIKYEYGIMWIFGIPFYLFISIITFKNYLSTYNIYLLFISISISVFLILLFYRRFIKTTALQLSEKGMKVFPLFGRSYFVPWKHIDKFVLSSTNASGSPIRIKSVAFYYKEEYETRIFFKRRQVPIFAYHNDNVKRLKEVHNKYKNQ